MGTVSRLLQGYRAVAIDTNCFIYHLQAGQFPDQAALVGELFEMVERGQLGAVTSPITIVEIMTRPRKLGLEEVAYQYKMVLTNFPNLHIPPITALTADRAAALRGAHNLKTPDALQIAAGMVSGVSAFVTFDAELEKVSPSFRVVVLEPA